MAGLNEFTLAGALVKPLQSGRTEIAGVYEQFVSPGPGREVIAVSRSILREAARLRATTSLKLPDALHLASARLAGCASFLTNDATIRDVGVCPVVQLSALIP